MAGGSHHGETLGGDPVPAPFLPSCRFGDFLLANGRITHAQLVDALIVQTRACMPALEVLREIAQVPPDICLAILDEAERTRRHPFAIAEEWDRIPGWNQHRLREREIRRRPPLGQVLVQLGYASPLQMRAWLFEFMGYKEEPVTDSNRRSRTMQALEPKPSNRTEAAAATPPPAAAATPPPAPAALPTTGPLECDEAMIEEYRGFLDDHLRARLDERVLALRSDKEGEAWDSLYRDFHSIKGSANFLGAQATVHLVHLMEDTLTIAKRMAPDLDTAIRQQLVDLLFAGLDLVWELRAGIIGERNEHARLHAHAARYQQTEHSLVTLATSLASQVKTSNAPISEMF